MNSLLFRKHDVDILIASTALAHLYRKQMK